MVSLRRFLLRLLTFFRSRRAETDLAREVDAHLQLLEDKFVADGMSAEDARFAARRAFGGVEQVKEQQRDARSFRWLNDSWADSKLGARMLIKYPGLSLVGGIAMAVAIGFGTASFAFFYSSLYPTLPLDEGDRTVALENWDVNANNEERQSLHDFVTWRDELKTMQDVGAFRTIGRNLIVPGGAVEPIRIAEMTASGFRIARVPPMLGRPLVEEDHNEGAPPVLVIGYKAWQSRFASDPAVVGRQVRIGNTVHTIVGVMPEPFAFPMNHGYWTPLRVDVARYQRGQGPEIFIFGRLAPGATFAEAQAELTTIGSRAASLYPETHARLRAQVLPYTYPLVDIQDVSLWQVALMQLMVSMLLVIVAVNVAILIYARTATRQGEIAVRSALGASRGRIVGQLFIEALVLSAASAAAGLALAKGGLSLIDQIMALEGIGSPFWSDRSLPVAAILYVFGLTVFAAVVAGVVPALQATGRGVQSTLRQLTGSTGMQLGRTWTVLIVAQVAFAVAALPMAAAIGWNEVRFATTKPQFAVEQFLAARVAMDQDPPAGTDPDTYRREIRSRFMAFRSELVSRLESGAWVTDITFGHALPGQEPSARVEIEGLSLSSGAAGRAVHFNRVDFDFFAAFDAQILTGRAFHEGDREVSGAAARPERPSASRAIIVNRTFVQEILGGGDALGRRVRYVAPEDADPGDVQTEQWYEIVGVVQDLHANSLAPEMVRAEMYHAIAADAHPVSLAVRVRGDNPAALVARLREVTAALDPTLRLGVYPLLDIYRQENVALRLVALAIGLITVSVLLLSAAGIYALMSFTVAQRRKEIGIRTALGAEPRRLLWNIFARAARQLAIGLVVGIVTVATLDLASGGDLMGGQSAILVSTISALMLVAGLVAAIGPARRGLRIEPTQALRDQ